MTRITENQWIEYFGFQRFPFDRPEAGNEEFARPDFLAACFVEPNRFERVLGQPEPPVTALLFAARGTGKTACRVMVDYYCRKGYLLPSTSSSTQLSSYILSVPHINLLQVQQLAQMAASSKDAPTVTVEHHCFEILCRAVPALVELIASTPGLFDFIGDLSLATRQDLSWLIFHYRLYLSSEQANFLNRLGLWPIVEERLPMGFQVGGIEGERVRPLPGASDLLQSRTLLSPLEHLAQLAELVRLLQIRATYILVDGVDEYTEAAGSPQEAYRVIRPLLTTLRLMDGTRYLAFKFFLPDTLEPLLLADRAFRQDRGFPIEHIHWQDNDLIEILRRRLHALRTEAGQDRLMSGFDELCVPELRGRIENDLARWAGGNPRHLMVLCGLIVNAHCEDEINDQEDPFQLNGQDVERALEQFAARIARWQKPVESSRRLPLEKLIAQGEHERLEFKASLQWDLGKGAISKEMREVIGRTLAGMMNRHGGTVLIGVADDGRIVGIENDLRALRKSNVDGFQLEIARVVETYLGRAAGAFLQIAFKRAYGKTVCVITIHPSPEPIYFRSNNQSEFWVRLGNSTRKLDVKEAIAYIKSQ